MHPVKHFTLIALAAFVGFTATASAAEKDEIFAAQTVVNDAVETLRNFESDSKQAWFRENVGKARGLFIVPRLGKGGFIFAGSGGRGLVVARDESTGNWSQPAFYTVASASIGLQAGAAQMAHRALEMVQRGSHDEGRLLSQYSTTVYFEENDFDAARDAYTRALAVAQRENDIELELRTLSNAAAVDTFPDSA